MIRTLLAFFAVLSFAVPVLAAEGPANVVFIVGDDQAWFDFGFMGSKDVSTPNLDRLAAESAVFTRGYVPSSVCMPSLATMITGRFPHETENGTGVQGLSLQPKVIRQMFEQYPPIPTRLANKNYLSMQTGKWWAGDFKLAGFTHGMQEGKPTAGSTLQERKDAVNVRKGPNAGALDKGLSFLGGGEGIRIGREGLGPIEEFLKERDGKPFFVWYAPMMPHVPHDPPRRLYEKYKKEGRPEPVVLYMAMCEWFDETVGDLMKLLDAQKARENTAIVFVVDNGYVPAKGLAGFFDKRSKISPYDAGLRTPILVNWPGRIKPARYETPVHTIDLMPTTLAIAGLPQSKELPGVNLLDFCDGKPPKRDAVFGEIFQNRVAGAKTAADTMSYRWCVSGDWKLILPRDYEKNAPELYNVVADPREEKDLAAEHKEKVEELTKKIEAWWPLGSLEEKEILPPPKRAA